MTQSTMDDKRQKAATQATGQECGQQNIKSLPPGIDPATLAELPPDMVQQIVQDYKDVVRTKMTTTVPATKKQKPARIDHFFKRKL